MHRFGWSGIVVTIQLMLLALFPMSSTSTTAFPASGCASFSLNIGVSCSAPLLACGVIASHTIFLLASSTLPQLLSRLLSLPSERLGNRSSALALLKCGVPEVQDAQKRDDEDVACQHQLGLRRMRAMFNLPMMKPTAPSAKLNVLRTSSKNALRVL